MKKHIDSLKDVMREAFKKGFFNLLIANLLINVMAFASQLFVAKVLLPEDMGRIKLLQIYLSIFTIVGSLGLASSTLKLCSEERNGEDIKNIFRYGLFFTLISTGILYVILLLINHFNVFSSDKVLQAIFPLALFPLISHSLFLIFTSYFQGLKQIKTLSNLTSANKILSIIGIIVFTYYFGIKGYYWAYNISVILMLMLCFRLLKGYSIFRKIEQREISEYASMHWRYAKPSIGALALSNIMDFADILLISFMIKDMREVGFYGFALTVIVVLKIIPATIQQISSPYFSSKSNQPAEFRAVYKKYFKLTVIIIAAALIAAIALGPTLIDIVFNYKYHQSIPYFIPLAIGWSIRQINQIQAAALFGLGKINHIAYAHLISIAINIPALLTAFFSFGVIGVAYASIFCSIVSVSSFYLFLRGDLRSSEV